MQIMITLNQIRACDPCAGGWRKILEARGGADADFDAPFPLADALDSNGLRDTLWALRCLPVHGNLWRKYAVWCARQVQHLMTNPRSIAALDVAWAHSEGLATDAELARAAWAAEAAAWAAAEAAAEARAAAWAAWAAAAAAAEAAWAAAKSAAQARAAEAAWAAQAVKLRAILLAGEWVED